MPARSPSASAHSLDVDIVTLAQRFYETHEDAYDYLVVYNDLDISAGIGVIAYENTMRSRSLGHGVAVATTARSTARRRGCRRSLIWRG